ncbi:hypothetical protein QJS66_00675 [Kocuria rhizophila]|nr:hypothetical protein QJS66_00675 [Kocuria rhizophila]
MLQQAEDVVADYRAAFDALAFHRGWSLCWRVIASANRYFTAQEPWRCEQPTSAWPPCCTLRRGAAHRGHPRAAGDARSMARPPEQQLGQPEGEARMLSALGTRLAPGNGAAQAERCVPDATRSPPRSRPNPPAAGAPRPWTASCSRTTPRPRAVRFPQLDAARRCRTPRRRRAASFPAGWLRRHDSR